MHIRSLLEVQLPHGSSPVHFCVPRSQQKDRHLHYEIHTQIFLLLHSTLYEEMLASAAIRDEFGTDEGPTMPFLRISFSGAGAKAAWMSMAAALALTCLPYPSLLALSACCTGLDLQLCSFQGRSVDKPDAEVEVV